MVRLKNKIALITGGCGHIGLEIANLFMQNGATVIVVDIQDVDKLSLHNISNLEYLHFDVSDEQQWQTLSQLLRVKYNALDILINNAGIFGFNECSSPQNPEYMSFSDWNKIHNVNLNSVFLGCKYGIELMKKSGGSIINMSSRSAFIGVPSAAAYASSKAAIANYTKSVALYCAEMQYQITCNSIHPGIIHTQLWDPLLKNGKTSLDKMASNIPMGNVGNPIDVAYAALYLASDESKYVTGTEIAIDGGLSAGRISNPINAK